MSPQYSQHEIAIPILGRTIYVNTFGCKLTVDEENEALAVWQAAAAQINAQANAIPDDAKEAIARVQAIIVPASDATDIGETGHNAADGRFSITLSLAYLRVWSTAWNASLLAHEGGHAVVSGQFSGDDLWKSERYACEMQLKLGTPLHMPEIPYLESYMAVPAGIPKMQAHMVAGYAGPPLPAAA